MLWKQVFVQLVLSANRDGVLVKQNLELSKMVADNLLIDSQPSMRNSSITGEQVT